MGCGCSKQGRVAAQKSQVGEGKPSVGAAGGEIPLAPAATTAEETPPPIAQHTMLQHMSPPSSPGDDAPSRKPPVPSGTNTQQQLTSLSVPGKTKHPDAGAEGDNQGGHEDGRGLDDLALSPVASVDGLPSEEGGGVGGEVKREQKRPSELATLRLEKETQARLPRFSADPLPQIGLSRGSTNLTTAPNNGHPREANLEQGLSKDDGSRENDGTGCGKPANDASDSASAGGGINNAHGDQQTLATPVHSAPLDATTATTTRDIESERMETEASLVVPAGESTAGVVPTPVTVTSLEVPPASNDCRDSRHDSELPPKQEARPALFAVESGAALSVDGERQENDAVFFSDANNDQGVNRRDSSRTGNWAETSDSLLDADEEDFMESLLLDE